MRLLPSRLILPPLPKPSPDKSIRRHTFSAGRWADWLPVFDRALSRQIRSLCLTASFARLTADTDYPEGLAQPALGKMVGAFQQDYAKHIKQFLQLQLLHTPHSGEILNRVLPDLARCGTPSALQAALEAVNHADARPLLPLIQTPSLLVFGQKDAITPPRMGEYLHRHLSNSELVLIDKAAHAPFLSHADEFAETYRNFVEKDV